MLRFFTMLLLAAASFPVIALEEKDCGGSLDVVKVAGTIGVPTDYTTLDHNSVTLSPPIELLRVQIAWLPKDDAKRYRYQETIDIDWKARTHTQVDLYDNQVDGIVTKGIRPAEFLPDVSDFDSGHLDMIFCMPDYYDARGLVFAYYGTEGKIEHTYVAPFRVDLTRDGLWFSAVINEFTSALINNSFNNSIVHDVTTDVEMSTGVRPNRYLAETLIQDNLQSTTDLVARDHVMAFAPDNARVVGNQIVVTGDNASVSVVHGVEKVFSNGQKIPMENFRISHLEDYLGPISLEIHGLRHAAYIIDSRGDLQASATRCVAGMSTIRAQMKYESLFLNNLLLKSYKPDYVQDVFNGPPPMVVTVSCDSDYVLYPSRRRYGETRDTKEAYFRFDDPAAYEIVLFYWFHGDELDHNNVPTARRITPDIVRKIWGIEDLDQLWGETRFGCASPGDATVDSVDEILSTARATLSQDELETMGLGDDADIADLKLDDSDGDGSVCNRGEYANKTYYVDEISLRVRPNLGHPDFLVNN